MKTVKKPKFEYPPAIAIMRNFETFEKSFLRHSGLDPESRKYL